MDLENDRKEHILLVDDDPPILSIFGAYLREEGFRVTAAVRGAEAVELLKSAEFDLIVTDLVMPEVDGFRVMEAAAVHNPDAPVIVLSGQGTVDNAAKVIKLGAYDFLTKPIPRLDVLLIAVKRALEKRRLQEAHLRYLARIENQNKALRQDLRAARQIQISIMNRDYTPFAGELAITGRYIPAERVGGDFYDVIAFGPGRVLFYMAEVASQGVTAAMVTVYAKQLLGRMADEARLSSGGEAECLLGIASDFNREICAQKFNRHGESIQLTIFFGLLETATGRLAYGNAGHVPAARLIRRDGTLSVLDAGGVPVGIMEQLSIRIEETRLGSGDLIFLTTIGLTDETGPSNEPFGILRLDRILAGLAGASPDDSLEAVLDAAATYRGEAPQIDDFAILVLSPRHH